jgi:PhnB protein
MTKSTKPIPNGYHTLTPYLTVRGAAEAIEFYKKAFGAEVHGQMPAPDGRVMHAELQIGDSRIMLADEFPDMGSRAPATLGGTAGGVHVYVQDVDAAWARAVAAGATVVMPLADMFWGDRYGKLRDPYGHEWSLASHTEDLTEAEMGQRAAAAFAPPATK